ncbi:methyl-accepting chemotaxis protein [Bacillus sp. DTU_2020_1000418_1_SI_GHA_SEK_038]|uniref:methyl-accepting chemotaxis protein n=1 Tax=Bacillus sp. DTU_2020_1000418_1_SI_GHA_SEK_038 TaxID=3077585 RepID=UPI0028E48745|nr:methyl-accepting chemotaxis protein [Bacillus sp. DTU_2020_1000418_1_SI_GHA_SEK_038]WNS75795.1 methyl-accepting chemotaxis protein [Bacillus sp. DTU_2020_1000418_1_SI_GHA_SEK_038]
MYHMNLRKKLIFVSFIFLCVPSLLIGLVSYQLSLNSLNESGKLMLKNSVKQTIELINTMDQEVKMGRISLEEAQEYVKVSILGEKLADGTRPINKNINLGENGYFYIIDEKGMQVADPYLEGTNTWDYKDSEGEYFFQKMIKAVQTQGSIYIDTMWELPDKPGEMALNVSYAELEPTWGWIVCTNSFYQDFNQRANDIVTVLAITLAVSLAVGGIIIILFSRMISNPLVKLANQVKQVADGDLTMDVLNVKNKDEIGVLVQGFHQMVQNIKMLISQIMFMSQQVATSSEQLTANAEQNAKTTEQIVSAIQEVASGSEAQTAGAEDTVRKMSGMDIGLQSVAANCVEVSQEAEKSSIQAEEGNVSLQHLVSQMKMIRSTVEQSNSSIKKLNDRSLEIGNILEIIRRIADQTNLLALNAAIEAARAGEQGRGFAVVAGEVRLLAEQSTNSVQHIANIIQEIQAETEKSVHTMDVVNAEVDTGLDIAKETEQKFQEILSSLRHVANQIQDVSTTSQQMSASSQEITASAEEMSRIAQNSSDYSRSVAAASEEQLASMEEIAASASSLSDLAEEMQALVSKFRVE